MKQKQIEKEIQIIGKNYQILISFIADTKIRSFPDFLFHNLSFV